MTPKVFVSSTFRDLEEHRRHVVKTLERSGFFVITMEKWTAATDAPQKFSQDRLKGCDLCVLLVAFRRGHVPRGRKRSITQLEYEAARKLGVDTLVFMLDEQETEWPVEFNELEKDPELRRWRKELMETKGVGFFNHKPESVEVATAVSNWLRDRAGRANDETKSRLADEVNTAVTEFVLAVQVAERGSIKQGDYDAAYFAWEGRHPRLASELREKFRDTDLAARWAALADAVTALYRLSGTWSEPYRGNVLRELTAFFPEVTDGWDDLRDHRKKFQSEQDFQNFTAAWWKLREAALARKDDLVGRILAA